MDFIRVKMGAGKFWMVLDLAGREKTRQFEVNLMIALGSNTMLFL